MSLRYTGEATMDQPALRDVERWKDKIEVRLDNRQVFFLFFGSAMVACMLFVLGVIVGKRLETRGRAEAPQLEDPLAVLDRFGGAAAQAAPTPLAFPRTLIGGGNTTVVSGKSRAIAVERSEKPTRVEASARPEPVERPEPQAPAAPPVATKPTLASTVSAPALPRPAPVAEPVPAPSAPSRKLAALPRPLTAAGAPVPSLRTATPPKPAPQAATAPVAAAAPKAPTSKPVAAAAPVAKPVGSAGAAAKVAAAPADKDKSKSRFLLQLSSFQDRGEADAFARKFAGQNAYVVASEIPGKGTWYRVRVGSFSTMQEATAAKANFERDHNVIAYVAGSGPAH